MRQATRRRPGVAQIRAAEARSLTERALGGEPRLAAAALNARAEAQVAALVERGSDAPRMEHADTGPRGVGRGPVEFATISAMQLDAKRGGYRAAAERVLRRRGPGALARQPEHLQAAARRYLALHEEIASASAPADGGVRGGVSDGGATARVAKVAALRACRAAIGDGLVLSARRSGPSVARPLTVLALVDAVTLEDRAVSAILHAYGWPRTRSLVVAAQEALAAALARLAAQLGYSTPGD